jgi:hypothetical protein
MNSLAAVALLTGYCPLLRAWFANRATTLRPALTWATAAWTARLAATASADSMTLVYLALCLAACSGVAVLGARRPGVGAWNFVVGGLLVVLLLPVASGLGTPRLEPAHLIFLSASLAVVLLNYLPTRPGMAVPMVGIALAADLTRSAGINVPAIVNELAWIALALAPWIAWLALRCSGSAREVDRVWFAFRDGYGFLWAERVREQFNRSAASSGSRAHLGWKGLVPAGADDGESLRTLQALLKRFGPVETESSRKASASQDDAD